MTNPDRSSRLKYPDGSSRLKYPDRSSRLKYPDGSSRLKYPDGSSRLTKYILSLLFLTACSAPQDKDFVVELHDKEIVNTKEPGATTSIELLDRGSHITFRCSSKWVGVPIDFRAPRGLLSKVCVSQRCVKNDLGAVAEITIWSRDFDIIENADYVYCLVYMPAWFTLKGFPPNQTIDEYFHEHLILSIRYRVETYWKDIPSDFRDYCIEVECSHDGCECLRWE